MMKKKQKTNSGIEVQRDDETETLMTMQEL